MTSTEVKLRKLNRSLDRITTFINSDQYHQTLMDELRRFEDLIDTLPDQAVINGKPARQLYENALKKAWTLVLDHEKEKNDLTNTNESFVVKPEPKSKLPRDPLPSWNGDIESFCPFWIIFNDRVLNDNELDDTEKRSRLVSALPEHVKFRVIGKELEEAKKALISKYQSEQAICEHIELKLADVNIKDNSDVVSMRALSDLAERSKLLINTVHDLSPGTDINVFNLIYSRLPKDLRWKYWETNDKKDLDLLAKFTEKQVRIVLSDRSSFIDPSMSTISNDPISNQTISTQTISTQTIANQPISTQTISNQTSCNYCKANGHLIKECPKKLATKCFNCNAMGHISKFCKAPKHARSPVPIIASTTARITPENPFVFKGQVDGQDLDLLLDTGAKTSMLPQSKCPVDDHVGTKRFGAADKSTSFTARGPVQKELIVADKTKLELNTFVGEPRVPIIGRDFIKRYDIKWDGSKLVGTKDGTPFVLRKDRQRPEEEPDDLGINGLFCLVSDDLDDPGPTKDKICDDVNPLKPVSDRTENLNDPDHCQPTSNSIPGPPDAQYEKLDEQRSCHDSPAPVLAGGGRWSVPEPPEDSTLVPNTDGHVHSIRSTPCTDDQPPMDTSRRRGWPLRKEGGVAVARGMFQNGC